MRNIKELAQIFVNNQAKYRDEGAPHYILAENVEILNRLRAAGWYIQQLAEGFYLTPHEAALLKKIDKELITPKEVKR